jgi:starch synthase
MKIAIVASEAVPFAKTGGLADVTGALPKALFRLGHEPILILPLHRAVRRSGAALSEAGSIVVPVGKRWIQSRLWRGEVPGIDAAAYFLEQDSYFDRDGIYGYNDDDYADNCERFSFLSRGALEAVRSLGFDADVFHLHDWQSALVAPYLRILYSADPLLRSAAALLTIHNIAYQGMFWHWDMDVLGLDWSHFNIREFEFWGRINLLKAGIIYADVVNTVSPTYAREIQTLEQGWGLDGVLRDRHDVLHGVVNGIDDAVWNPAADPHLTTRFGPEDLRGKAACKAALQRQCGLPQRKVPLIGIVSRFAEQKGLDLAAKALPDLFDRGPLQCVILGDGGDGVQVLIESVAKQFPDRLRAFAQMDERLAHRIIAGADMILVPSRFEPCGLTQLYGLKYGSVPIVRRTGGLVDTVADCTPETLEAGTATGFLFDDPTPEALGECVQRALDLYHDAASWRRLMVAGMSQDWSWESSAKRYLDLYAEARALHQSGDRARR